MAKKPRKQYPICGAKRQDGSVCKGQPLKGGNGRCKFHNGMALRGVMHPRYKHGKYVKHMPASLIDMYKDSLNDEGIKTLNEEIAVSEAMLADALNAIDELKSTDFIDDPEQLELRIMAMKSAWLQADKAIEQLRKLKTDDLKMQISRKYVLTAEQLMIFVNRLRMAIKEVVTDRKQLTAIEKEFRKLGV